MTSGATVAYGPEEGGGVSPPPPPPPPATAWYEGFDADTKAYITNNGHGTKTLAEAFAETAKAHQAAQSYIGVKPEQIVKLPADDNPEAWKDVWRKLGAPDSPDKYDFTTVKKADGSAPDEADIAFVRATAAKLNLPLAAAQALASELTARQDKATQDAGIVLAGRVAEQKTALRTQWAQNFEANEFVARQAMAAFGLTPEQIAGVENSPNVAAAMETWRQIGTRIGEDKFVNNGGGPRPAGGAMTLEEARGRKAELMGDGDWTKRFLAGGVEEKRTMAQIDNMIAQAAA